jgi:hypothetical protein
MPGMTSRGPEDVASAKASNEDVVDAVGLLVGELEDFAFERERVLAKLDIRAASTARRLGRELSLLLRGLPLASDEEAHDEIHDTLGCLLEEAHRILSPEEPVRVAPAVRVEPASAEADDGGPDVARPVSSAPQSSAPQSSAPQSSAPQSSAPQSSERVRAPEGDEPLGNGEEAPLESGERATAHGVVLGASGLPRGFHDEDDLFAEETIARKVSWERSGNRVLGR